MVYFFALLCQLDLDQQIVQNTMEMQQKMSKNDRNLEMKRRLKEQYDGDELKKKLKILKLN